MARPIKDNADYFSHDSDMRNDRKIKALRRKFGNEGYAVYCFTLEVLTDASNFEIEWDDLQVELLSGDFDVESNLLVEIILYCSETLGLFNIDNGFLQCYQLRKRFDSLLSKRKRQRFGVIDDDNTHSKVKYSKVKKSKVKESIEKNEDENFNENSSPPISQSNVDESGNKKEKKLDWSTLDINAINVMKENHALFPHDVTSKLTNKQKFEWVIEIEKLNKLDGYDYDTINRVIKFGREDDFWKENFLSVLSLRKKRDGITKFVKIKTQLENGNKQQKGFTYDSDAGREKAKQVANAIAEVHRKHFESMQQ